jgi:hypothetical protein
VADDERQAGTGCVGGARKGGIMIIQHCKGYLQPEDIAEIARLFSECPTSHNSYQNDDTVLLVALLRSPLFKKLKASLLHDYYVCEAWFIIGEKYNWHSDAHVDVFSDTVLNLWIPYELSPDAEVPVMEYYHEDRAARRRVREARNLIRALVIARSLTSKLSRWVDLGPWVERSFAKLSGTQQRAIRQVEIGDILVLDPSFLHRSGPRKKKVLAIQCVPKNILPDPRVSSYHSAHTSLVARKALAAVFLQGQLESAGEARVPVTG